MKNILMIGGAGYVGSILTAHFLKLGYKVTVLDNFIYDHHFSALSFIGDPFYRFVLGNLSDTDKLSCASEGVTDVIILAGLVGDPITKKYPELSKTINDKGVKTCIDFFDNKKINKLVFISTCSNYGLIKENELADEEFDLKPLSLYATAKVDNEKYLLNKKNNVDYTGVVLRFATAFGLSPRMRFDLTISEFTRDLYFGKDLLVYDEHTWRPYCHLRDFARLLELVLNAPKKLVDFEVFNSGGDMNNYTKKMIVDEILKHLPNRKVVYGENGSDPRNYKVSFKKVSSRLGFEPKFSVKDGISELINAFYIGLFNDSIDLFEKYGNYKIIK